MIAFLDIWYSVPLIVAISLVYGATRHEEIRPILHYAWQMAVWLVGFVVILGAVVCAIDWML